MALGNPCPLSKTTKPKGKPCVDYEPRKMPLLMDELANMVWKLSDPKTQGLGEAAYAALIDEAEHLLERHKEEVGDA